MVYLINAESTITAVNPGMKTVDMAWDIFLQKNHLALPYKRFSIKAKEQTIHVTDTMHLHYNSSLDFDLSMLGKDDILVFWGDFLHAHHYLKNDLLRIARKRKLKHYLFDLFKNPKLQRFNDNNYLDWAYEFYLLQGAEQKHWKGSISFGTTLIGDHDFEIMKQKNYMDSFTKFIQNLDRIWTRDVHSALQAAHIREDYLKSYLGVDAALLIAPEDYDSILDVPSVTLPEEKYILTHFARTEAPINQLLTLAQRISIELKMPLFWFPWLNHLDENFKGSLDEINAGSYSDLIHTLKNASLVVTDTYHLALIGWRLGVPVLCIGSGVHYPSSTVHDKKKEVFYMMHNMLPFYFYSELLNDKKSIDNYVALVKNEFSDKRSIDRIINKIKINSESIEKDLATYFHDKTNERLSFLISPKISVIIPVYNVETYLEECLDSILAQDLSDIEIICVNDGSTDSSLSILERYAAKDKRIIMVNQENGGPGKARNNGLKKAQGKYIFFPDSDDYLLTSNALTLLYKTAIERDLDIVSSNFATVGEEQKESLAKRKSGIVSDGKRFLLSGETNAAAWAKLYKRSYLDLIHFLFDETIFYEDSEAFPRFYINASRVSHIDAVLYAYRQRPNSVMTQNVNLKYFTGLKAIIATYTALLKKEPDSSFQKYLKKQIYNNVLYFNHLILRSDLPPATLAKIYDDIKAHLTFSKLELYLVQNDEKFIQYVRRYTKHKFSHPMIYMIRKLRKFLI